MVTKFIEENNHIQKRFDKIDNSFFLSPCNLNRQGVNKSAKDNSAKGLPEEELNKLRKEG